MEYTEVVFQEEMDDIVKEEVENIENISKKKAVDTEHSVKEGA